MLMAEPSWGNQDGMALRARPGRVVGSGQTCVQRPVLGRDRAMRRVGYQPWQVSGEAWPRVQLGAMAGAAEGRAGFLGLEGLRRLDVQNRKLGVQSLWVLSQGHGGQGREHRASPANTLQPLCLLARNTPQREHMCCYF